MRNRIGLIFWAREACLNFRILVICVVFCLGGGLLASGVKAAEPVSERGLLIGVAPHTSVRALFASYQPLSLFLQQALQRDVRIVSAPNFEEFLTRAMAGRYDIAITTGHQARLLQTDAGFLPLVTYQADFRVVWIKAANNHAIHRLEDLNGQKVLSLGPSSLTALWSAQQLAERGVVPAEIGYVSASDSVVELILAGSVKAAALSQANIDRLAPHVRQKLHIFESSPSFLGRVYMLNPRLADEYAAIRQALDAYARTEAAQDYFKNNQLVGYRDVPPAELELMEPYAQQLREQMKAQDKAKNTENPTHDAR